MARNAEQKSVARGKRPIEWARVVERMRHVSNGPDKDTLEIESMPGYGEETACATVAT